MIGIDAVRGSLLAGAVGDALGAPVEFMGLDDIRARWGRDGVTGYPPGEGGRITDDTQMTLFTAEGLIRARVRYRAEGVTDAAGVVLRSYRRWLSTQQSGVDDVELDGWLLAQPVLHAVRAPGATCLSALGDGRRGTVADPLNDSKGCGGVMRVAPAGLIGRGPRSSFRLAAELAAITHGHPSGYLAAGALAAMVSSIVHDDAPLPDAVNEGRAAVREYPGHEEVSRALDAAVALAARKDPAPEDLEALGGGWVAEEALAIGVAVALSHPDDMAGALTLAVTHSGDSDSTGSICGNLLGAVLGPDAIPPPWLDGLDARDVVDAVARDLWTEAHDPPSRGPDARGVPDGWWSRYPG